MNPDEGDRPAELLAPAGDERALRAVLAAGADAVYLGMERFSARAFAGNFDEAGVLAAIDRAHAYNARVHLAVNTHLKREELAEALTALAGPYQAGLDALIVADLGLTAALTRAYPELHLHASTQLATHSSAQVAMLGRLGFRRVVLARELSLAEIEALDAGAVELEVFAHGALCYSYSGACLFSSMLGGRSGNRGRCSQACRMRYTLRSRDSSVRAGGEHRGRIISTADLCALEFLPRLLAAGVRAFKIEGRMKDAAYVATATAVYREALESARADPAGYQVRPDWRARLEQSFSRGFTVAHLRGRHAEVRNPRRGGHRGVLVGRVEVVDQERGLVGVRLTQPVAAGDVLVIYTPWGQTDPLRVLASAQEDGVAAAAGQSEPGRLTLRVGERVAIKDRVFRLSSGRLDSFAEDAVTGRMAARPVALHARLEARPGLPARLRLRADGESIEVVGAEPLETAQRARLNSGRARDAVAALGGTPYRLGEWSCDLEGDPFLPIGALKELRRRGLAELDARRLRRWRRNLDPAALEASRAALPGAAAGRAPARVPPLPVILHLRLDEEPLLAPGVAALVLDLYPGDAVADVAAAVERLAAAGLPLRCRPPEILFDGGMPWWAAVRALPWEAVYARHLAHISAGRVPAILEYPLQGLNALTARLLGARAVVASPESSLTEIAALAADLSVAPAIGVEMYAFGRQQLMVTRDVLGAAEGLANPDAWTYLELVDAKHFVFPVEAGPEGSVIFNSRVTNVAAAERELADAGVSALHVVQRELLPAERAAFAAGGLRALAVYASSDRSTTGHLYRGVH